jgi:translocation and assembly module TamB
VIRKRLLIAAAILAGALLVLVVGFLLLIRSPWFHEQVRARIVYEVEKATGGRVELGSFVFDWKTLEACAENFTLHGKELASEKPLFHAKAIRVGLKVISAWRRDIDIASLVVDHPAVNILVAADGSTNIPVPPGARARRNPLEQIIALEIGHINLQDGLVRYDSQTIPLDLKGERVQARLDYDRERQRYTGQVSAGPVAVRTAGIKPFSVNSVTASVAAAGNNILISRAHAALNRSWVDASGSIDDFKNLRAAFAVKAKGAMSEIGPIVKSPLLPQGNGEFSGTVRLGGARPIEIAGVVQGQGLGYSYQGWTVKEATARARVHFTTEHTELSDLRVNALGGAFRGRADLENLRRFRVKGNVDGFSLARLSQGKLDKPLPWSGTVSGPLEMEGQIDRARIAGTRISAKFGIAPREGGVPLSGLVDLGYEQRDGSVRFGPSWLQTPSTHLNFDGVAGDKLHAGVVSSNLNDVIPALALFSENPPDRLPLELKPPAEARFDGFVLGKLDDPHITGHATLGSFVYEGKTIDAVSADINAGRDSIRADALNLAMGSLRLEGEGTLGLREWRLPDDPAVDGKLSVHNADLKSLLFENGHDIPVRGVVDATVAFHGTLSDRQGSGKVQGVNLYLGDQHFDQGTADVSYAGATMTVSSGQLRSGNSKVALTGTWTHSKDTWKSGTVEGTISTAGFPLSGIAAVQNAEMQVDGALDVTGTFSAAFDGKTTRVTGVNGRLNLHDLRYQDAALGSVALNAVTQSGRVKVAGSGSLRESKISGNAVIELAGDYPGGGEFTLSRLDLADLEPFLSGQYPNGLPVRGFLTARATLGGAVLAPEGIRAQVQVDAVEIRPRERESLGAQLTTPADLVLRNSGPLALSVDRKGITIQRAEFVARNTDFFASGSLAFGSKNPWDLKLTGKIELAILDSFNRDIRATGVSTIDATVRGAFGQPQVNGRMELANASFSLRGVPNGIDKANGVILFDRNRANIEKLTAQTGGGEISLGGFVGLGNEMVYRLQAKANRVRVRYPEGVSTTVDADLSLTGTSSRSLLSGTVSVVRSGFTPRTDLAGLLAQAGKPVPAPATPNEFLQGLQFDVKVVTAPNSEFQTALTRNLQMEASLRLRGSPAKPILLGTVRVNRGEIQFFGNKYIINRGDISFFNAARIEPIVNMDLETRQRGVTVNINFSGPIDKLNVTYRSDPPLQPSEIIALLTVGRSPASTDPTIASGLQQVQGNQSLFQSGANSLLGAALTAPVSGRLERFFGVSSVKIDPQLTGIDNTPQSRLTLEQQISNDVTLTYVTNLNRSQQQLVRLEWDLTQEWSVVAVRDENGVFGIDFQWRRRFH